MRPHSGIGGRFTPKPPVCVACSPAPTTPSTLFKGLGFGVELYKWPNLALAGYTKEKEGRGAVVSPAKADSKNKPKTKEDKKKQRKTKKNKEKQRKTKKKKEKERKRKKRKNHKEKQRKIQKRAVVQNSCILGPSQAWKQRTQSRPETQPARCARRKNKHSLTTHRRDDSDH